MQSRQAEHFQLLDWDVRKLYQGITLKLEKWKKGLGFRV
jgi:hypothetical protein